jgi:solute:Na+ symporter, SSS family
MIISSLDWIIIIVYLLISIGISLYFSKKAGRSTGNFFLSGRNLPWYIAGTSMVATTFAADTPLAVTELVSQNGIAGNWLWWNMLFGGMITVFFFARLWRRAEILTDAEFVSIRYSGREASFLRGFRAIYIGILMNTIVIGWVNLAMVKIFQVIFPDFLFFGVESISILGMEFSSHLLLVGSLLLFVAFYTSLSGLMGVSFTDSVQFVMAMTGSIVLAVFAVREVGGIEAMKANLEHSKWVFDFFPSFRESSEPLLAGSGVLKLSVTAFVAYLGVQWWSSWYPGAEPGGGGYVAQRMMSAKNEKHSLLATLWFQIAHFALRPWPWILVALSTLILYPAEADRGATYVMVIRDYLPSGFTGLLLAAFFAAFMSTIASQTVWGTSYIVNDLFKPFIKPKASEKYYIMISRITTYVLIIFSLIVTTQFTRISDAWKFVIVMSTGIGLVLILRWFWWRINAWSEISAMLAPYAIFPVLKYGFGLDPISADFEQCLLIIVVWSTAVWVTVTMLTKPSDESVLKSFYTKVHPGGPGWKSYRKICPDIVPDSGYGYLFLNWLLGCVMVMGFLFGFGKLLFQEYTYAVIFLGIAVIAGLAIIRIMKVIGWKAIK